MQSYICILYSVAITGHSTLIEKKKPGTQGAPLLEINKATLNNLRLTSNILFRGNEQSQ